MAAGDVETNINTMNARAGALFDGVDDYVEVAHNDNQLGANLTEGFTISAWVMPRSAGESDVGRILDKTTGTSADDGFYVRTQSLGRPQIRINGGTAITTGVDALTIGVWNYLTVTISSAQICTIYVNCVSKGTGDLVQNISTITTTNAPRIGNRSAATDGTWDGGISQVKMWNKVLTAEEMEADYSGRPTATDNLIINVPLQKNYDDVTNSGSILTISDDAVAASIKADRTTANDKYLMVGVAGQIVSTVIEEAP